MKPPDAAQSDEPRILARKVRRTEHDEMRTCLGRLEVEKATGKMRATVGVDETSPSDVD